MRADVDDRLFEHRWDVRRLEGRRDDDGSSDLGSMLARPRGERSAHTQTHHDHRVAEA